MKLQRLFTLNVLIGAIVLFFLLQGKSTDKNAVLWGYSSWYLVMILCSLLVWLGFIVLSTATLYRPQTADRASGRLTKFYVLSRYAYYAYPATIAIGLSIIGLAVVWLTGNWDRLGGPGMIIERGLPLILWLATLYLEFFFYYHIENKPKTLPSEWDGQALLSLTLTTAVVVFIVLDTLLRTNGFGLARLRQLLQTQILPNSLWIIGLGTAYLLLGRNAKKQSAGGDATSILIRRGLTVFVATWFIYTLSAVAVNHTRTPDQAYSPNLAAAFLQGKTYLDHPTSTVDLAYRNGHWYMPQPPLAALLMSPQVALFGPASVNTINFSILFAALNSALVFLILKKLRKLAWLRLSDPAIAWFTALFTLGSVHWYLALWGEVWVINQILTVTFVAIAALLTLSNRPAWLTGLSLGLAMLARPHIALIWPFLFGIYWETQKGQENAVRKQALLKWAFLSTLPIAVIIAGLLWYNDLRFGSPLDFGYVGSSVGLFHHELQTYGQFNVRFVIRNLQVMLIGLPAWNAACGFFSPSEVGMSVFITTPALLYLYRARKNAYWVIGAWFATGLLATILLLHYSTGALQFGYRYLMDPIIPLMALLGLSSQSEEIPFSMKTLILAGILVNYWGLWWFFAHWCR